MLHLITILALALSVGDELPTNGGFEAKAGKKDPVPGWLLELGATNGAEKPASQVDLDKKEKHSGKASLHFQGKTETSGWIIAKQAVTVRPGGDYTLTGWTKTKGVTREAIQFNNCYLGLFFFDGADELVARQLRTPDQPTAGWSKKTIQLVVPDTARTGWIYAFLSKTGDLWIDDLHLESMPGGTPPYADFVEEQKGCITLHWSKNDPNAKNAKQYLQRLVDEKAEICRRMELEWSEPIHVFLYRDDTAGRQLTGRSLDYADPSGRKVHQRWNSFIAHEMVHVIVHNSLQNSQTGILGEGIAVWLNSQGDTAHHRRAAQLLAKGELPSVDGLLNDFGNQSNSYPASGSFVGWFISAHGLAVFKEIYPLKDPSSRTEELIGKRLEELEGDWHEELGKFK